MKRWQLVCGQLAHPTGRSGWCSTVVEEPRWSGLVVGSTEVVSGQAVCCSTVVEPEAEESSTEAGLGLVVPVLKTALVVGCIGSEERTADPVERTVVLEELRSFVEAGSGCKHLVELVYLLSS